MFCTGVGAGVNSAAVHIFRILLNLSELVLSTDELYIELKTSILYFFTRNPLLVNETHFKSAKEKKDFLLEQRVNLSSFVEDILQFEEKPDRVLEFLEELSGAILELENLTDAKSSLSTSAGI